MSFKYVKPDKRTTIQKWGTNILKAGQIPKHIGIIPDIEKDSRTAANDLERFELYCTGLDKIFECCRWCLDFGVKEVTFLYFSIDDFKRREEEKWAIFEVTKGRLKLQLKDDAIMNEYAKNGVCIRFVGDWERTPKDLKPLMAEMMIRTRNNTKSILNIAFAYQARNEIARGADTLRKAVLAGDLEVEDLTEKLFSETLEILTCSSVDMILRTSSSTKGLDNFLLWQSSEAYLCFVPILWSALRFWDLWKCIFMYQANTRKISKVFLRTKDQNINARVQGRQMKYNANLRESYWSALCAETSLSVV